ncbi:MAG: 2Fe-2S iron-sulfur cluster binding domain-containing protein [Candidatus Binataceae bacterium]|jgi:NAD(P)H-flavin reductase/ferredoxin
MSGFQIRILPFDHQIECRPNQTILGALLEQGRYLRYGCKNGGCGSCKLQLVEGAVEQGGSSMALSPSERSNGYTLICTAMPLSDCTLDASAMELTEDEFASGDRTTAFIAEVECREALAPDIRRLYLQLVEPGTIKFTAGQFVNVEVPGSQASRAYSMANPPSDRHHIELIVKLMPNGAFSSYLESEIKVGDRLRLFGPLGQLKVRLSYRSILAIAGGSGMAPILSMLADLAEKGNARPITFFFGARREEDLYLQDRIESIRQRMPALETIFVLSDEQPPGWRGETGLVTEALARRLPTLKNCDAYLCGPPGMIEAAMPLLIERGVRERNIYFDAFVPSGGR